MFTYSKAVAREFQCDVLVIGGGPAGFGAAVAAARNGADTILIERNAMLGGMATTGLVGPFMTCYDDDCSEQIVKGVFDELCLRAEAKGGAIHPSKVDGMTTYSSYYIRSHCHVTPYLSEILALTMDEMVLEAGVKLLYNVQVVDAIREGKAAEMREKYRQANLLLVDDVQFIAGKKQTQEEFFHTFNTLYESGKQIVLTSDRPPSDILRLEDRLKTRFEWGLLADINPPDYETRMAIIREKSKSLGMEMPNDVCSYIAENITTNIRQIEGTVKKIKAYWELTGMDITKSNVASVIKDMYKGKPDALPTPELIIREVCRYYNISENVIRSSQRNKGTAEARQMAMYLIRSMTNLSYPDVGKEFGRDHTTAMHGVGKIESLLEDSTNPLHDTIRDIKANINNKL